MYVPTLKWAFTDVELERLHDEGLISLENENTLKQVAVQKDGLVVVNRKEFNMLDSDSKKALFIHEAVLRSVLVLKPSDIQQNGTAHVRKYTRRVYRVLNSPL